MAKPESTSNRKKKWRIRDEFIYDTIMQLVLADREKALRPEDIAMHIRKDDWQGLLKRIRIFVRKLAVEGYIDIIRKGKIADPDDFRGIYRVRSAADAPTYTPRAPQGAQKPEESNK